MKSIKYHVLFGLIMIFSIMLRFYALGDIPNGLYSDEAAYGYNAYSILTTGKDEYGQTMPLAFKSFGDYKAPLYIYFTVPFVAMFGLTEYAVRLPSAVLGVLLVSLLYWMGKLATGKNSVALLWSFFAAVTPFFLQFNRMAHENNLSVFLIVLGILFFIKSRKQNSSLTHLIISSLAFAFSLYAYHDARVFTPLTLLVLAVLYRREIFRHTMRYISAAAIFVVVSLPLMLAVQNPDILSRARYTNMMSDPGMVLSVNAQRGEDESGAFFQPALFHNKPIEIAMRFVSNYFSHFTYNFLFVGGDPVKIYRTTGNGVLLLSTLPFLLLGLYAYKQKRNFLSSKIFIVWLVLSLVPSSLTRFVPSASRSIILAPMLVYIITLGILLVNEYITSPLRNRILKVFISLILAFNIAYYLHYYYIHVPITDAREWHYGMKEVIAEVGRRQSGYERVWFSKKAWGYIYPLFYLKYPPEKYQPAARLGELNEYGFGWIEGFDKYTFDDFPPDLMSRKNTLFVGTPEEFGNVHAPVFQVFYPDGETAFTIADDSSL